MSNIATMTDEIYFYGRISLQLIANLCDNSKYFPNWFLYVFGCDVSVYAFLYLSATLAFSLMVYYLSSGAFVLSFSPINLFTQTQ